MHVVPNPAEDDRHAVLGAAPDRPLNEDQCDRNHSPGGEETAADNITLGAPLNEDSNTAQTRAGCVWDGGNWSCAYDAVFMSFWFIYRGSSPGWRNEWK
jgi:hypothetical protein